MWTVDIEIADGGIVAEKHTAQHWQADMQRKMEPTVDDGCIDAVPMREVAFKKKIYSIFTFSGD
jgi:hypothetical protein